MVPEKWYIYTKFGHECNPWAVKHFDSFKSLKVKAFYDSYEFPIIIIMKHQNNTAS